MKKLFPKLFPYALILVSVVAPLFSWAADTEPSAWEWYVSELKRLWGGAADAVIPSALSVAMPVVQLVLEFLGNVILMFGAFILWIAGLIFNATLDFTLNIGTFLKSVPLVDTGWTILRDLSNICFIFILLAIAIGTILQIDSYNVKKTLAKVIVVALLLNFSLFFTKVVIDTSNILALSVYQKMTASYNPSDPFANADRGLTGILVASLGLTTVYSQPAVSGDPATGGKAVAAALYAGGTTANILIAAIGGFIIMLTAAFVFLVATILFLVRTVTLVFLMILSPLAFLSLALPQTKGQFSKWWGTLVNQSFFAPVYLLMVFIFISAIQTPAYQNTLGKDKNFAALMAGNTNSVGTLLNYAIIIAFLLGSVYVANKMGAYGGSMARSIGGKLSFGAAGWVGRRGLGGAAKSLQESATVKKWATSTGIGGMAGRRLESGLKRASESSFDMRSVGGFGKVAGGLGEAGGKGGYAKSFKDAQKDLEDQKKRVTSLSQSEENAVFAGEEQKKQVEALRAGALLRERDAVEDRRTASSTLKNGINEQIVNTTTEIARLRAQAEIARERSTDASLPPAEQLAARNEFTRLTDEVNDSSGELIGLQKQLTDTNNEIKGFGDEIGKADELLKKIDDNYQVGGGRTENDEARFKMTEGAKKAQGWAQERGIDYATTSSDKFLKYTNAVQQIHINPIMDTAKARGKDYSKTSTLDEFAAKRFGITTARMAMVRGAREDSRKGEDKKLLEQIKKLAKEEGGAPEPAPAPAPAPAPTPTP